MSKMNVLRIFLPVGGIMKVRVVLLFDSYIIFDKTYSTNLHVYSANK